MSFVTTHVLDTVAGKPASGIRVVLEFRADANHSWARVGLGQTDQDGRVLNLLSEEAAPQPGYYCLRFDTSTASPFFPEIAVEFLITDPHQPYHVPLLLSRFGYSAYRGS